MTYRQHRLTTDIVSDENLVEKHAWMGKISQNFNEKISIIDVVKCNRYDCACETICAPFYHVFDIIDIDPPIENKQTNVCIILITYLEKFIKNVHRINLSGKGQF